MSGRCFLDTNLWVYACSTDPKGDTVRRLIAERFQEIVISTQILGELYAVLTRKLRREPAATRVLVRNLSEHFETRSVSPAIVLQAMAISEQYGYSYWDSQIIASALEHECSVLFSEDLHAGQHVDDRLQILNPLSSS